MSKLKTIDQMDVTGKKVLLRVDLNVPIFDGQVTDTTRILRVLITVRELIEKGATVVLLSHLGRPEGQVSLDLSLRPIVNVLSSALKVDVTFGLDCIGPKAVSAINNAPNGGIILLENLRFHDGEEKNDIDMAKALAALGDVYVNDAFSAAHRAHASTKAIAQLMPAAAGRLMQAELEALENVLENPTHPVAAIVGGAKVSTKMAILGHLIRKMDMVVIGGGMANTFLYANGMNVGTSLCEREMAADALAILNSALANNCEIILPMDVVVAPSCISNAPSETLELSAIQDDSMILDIGPITINRIKRRLSSCKTLVWNGPLGAFEFTPFDNGTNCIARKVGRLTKDGQLISVAGGGDTSSALINAGVLDNFSYVSTAGGAFLEWLEGRELPGVKALYSDP